MRREEEFDGHRASSCCPPYAPRTSLNIDLGILSRRTRNAVPTSPTESPPHGATLGGGHFDDDERVLMTEILPVLVSERMPPIDTFSYRYTCSVMNLFLP